MLAIFKGSCFQVFLIKLFLALGYATVHHLGISWEHIHINRYNSWQIPQITIHGLQHQWFRTLAFSLVGLQVQYIVSLKTNNWQVKQALTEDLNGELCIVMLGICVYILVYSSLNIHITVSIWNILRTHLKWKWLSWTHEENSCAWTQETPDSTF